MTPDKTQMYLIMVKSKHSEAKVLVNEVKKKKTNNADGFTADSNKKWENMP